MSLVDQFESVFRSSVRDVYLYEKIEYGSILLVTDLDGEPLENLLGVVKNFLNVLGEPASIRITPVSGKEFNTTSDLLGLVQQKGPDLVCTYRNLKSRAWKYPHSLGEHLDVLLQQTSVPVLVLPHPEAAYAKKDALGGAKTVMAITDHLSCDHKLVNHAARFTESEGRLFLTHIEDLDAFEKYMDAISKIPTIDTDDAREKIAGKLLKGPADFIESCRAGMREHDLPFTVEEIVMFGKRLSEYKKHVESQDVDLLVMNTKDDDQLAMHGLAYPLAVELRSIPLLML